MWKSSQEWDELLKGWIETTFKDIDTDEILSKSEYYTEIVINCVKILPNN